MKKTTFTVTENSEPINALKVLETFINKLDDDLYYWKWIIISAHNCLKLNCHFAKQWK